MKTRTIISILLRTTYLFLVLLIFSLPATAHDFEVDGIRYNRLGDEEAIVVRKDTYSGNITIPSVVMDGTKQRTVVSIGSRAFYQCQSLFSIILPNTVTSIREEAFAFCSALGSITFGNSINIIENSAFSNTAWLKSQSDGLVYAGTVVYSYKGFMPEGTSIEIKEGTKGIADYAFYNCSNLTNIVIPNTVTIIGGNSFKNCNNLTCINMPSFITLIGHRAFEGCSGLSSITIPNSVIEIGDFAFSGCNGLMRVDIKDMASWCKINFGGPTANPLWYAHRLFLNEMEVIDLNIPNSIAEIKSCAFFSCSSLKNVTIPNSVTQIGSSAFRNCIDLSNISIPESVYSIGEYAFDNTVWYENQSNGLVYAGLVAYKYKGTMPAGTSIVIKEGTKGLAAQALGDDGLTNITIPKSVTNIGFCALNGSGLRNIICLRITPPAYSGWFNPDIYHSALLSIPVGSLNAYLSSYPWNQFFNITEDPNNTSENMNFNVIIGPTSWMPDNSSLEGHAYIIINDDNETVQCLTGLEPQSINDVRAIYEHNGKKTYTFNSFTTPALSMTAKAADMITNKDARLMAETNMADVETSCGFEWRRYDAPEEMPSAKVYCPVYGGVMAGTLKNMSENVYYKYRPFYKSSEGNEYYGDWVAFITADAGVEFEPVVYTYDTPAVTQTDATLQGVALRGSEEITEQGFEYWKAGKTITLTASNDVTRVTAKGERMSKTVTGLQAGTKYKFRAYVIAGGETTYGAEVEFVTLPSSLDVNLDGEVNIADVNSVIDLIMDNDSIGTGDVNGDGEVNIADINTLIDAILSK